MKLLAMSSSKAKLIATLLGLKVHKFLILEHPQVKGGLARIEDGTLWSVSFVAGGHLVTFSAQVISSIRHGIPIIFLTYPDVIEQTSLRSGKRYPVMIKGSLNIDDPATGSAPAPAYIHDISEGGCQLTTTVSLELGAVANLTLEISGFKSLVGLAAEVKSCQEQKGRYIIGLSFAPGFVTPAYQELKTFFQSLEAMPLRL